MGTGAARGGGGTRVPEINGDEAAAAGGAPPRRRAPRRKRGRNDATRASSSAGPAGGRSARARRLSTARTVRRRADRARRASDEEDVPPAGSKSKSDSNAGEKPRFGRRRASRGARRRGGAAFARRVHAGGGGLAPPCPSRGPCARSARRARRSAAALGRDVRVAVVARALAAHAALRTHPEAIVVMTPLGEIIGSFLEDDRAARRTAERKRNAAERAARAAGIELDMDDLSASTIVDPATLKSAKKRAEAEEARRVAAALRADAAAADAAAAAPQFREELCVCAVEAVLPPAESGTAAAFKDEVERGAEKRGGLVPGGARGGGHRAAPRWPPAATGGRRAASDAATRLIAHRARRRARWLRRACAWRPACTSPRRGFSPRSCRRPRSRRRKAPRTTRRRRASRGWRARTSTFPLGRTRRNETTTKAPFRRRVCSPTPEKERRTMRSPWRCPAPWLSARPSPRNRAGRTGPWWSRWWRAWCAEAPRDSRGASARRRRNAKPGRCSVSFPKREA